MNNKILVLFALPEEKKYFVDSLQLCDIEVIQGEISFSKHRFYSEENGEMEFYSYVFSDKGTEPIHKELPDVLKKIQPNIVVNLGFAGAIKSANIGDVIVPTTICSVSLSKASEDINNNIKSQWEQSLISINTQLADFYRPGILIKDISMYQILYNLYMDKQEQELISDLYLNSTLNLSPIATIPFVLASETLKQEIPVINRKIYAVEMEAYAIQKEVVNCDKSILSLYIKGISDPSNKEKDEISEMQKNANRKYAMFNVSFAFSQLLDKKELFKTKKIDFYNDIVCAKHLSKNILHKKLKNVSSEEAFDMYFRFIDNFFAAYRSKKGDKKIIKSHKIIELLTTKGGNSIKIMGLAGTGKTSLLVVLYEYLLTFYKEEYIPIYIDINKYYNSTSESDVAIQYFLYDIMTISKSLVKTENSKIILIIDNIDYYRGNQAFLSMINKISSKIKTHSIVYGVKSLPKNSILFYPDVNDINAKFEYTLRGINYNDMKKEIIKLFLNTNYNPNTNEYQRLVNGIYDKIKEEKILNIDVLLLSEFCFCFINNLPCSYKDIVKSYINRSEKCVDITTLSQMAFLYHIRRDEDAISKLNYDVARLININPNISYFLIANYIIHVIRSKEENIKKEDLSFVYPYPINQFCKAIINEDINKQWDIFDHLKRIVEYERDGYWHLKAVACYLLGRFEDSTIKEQSKLFLINLLAKYKKINIDTLERDKYFFTLRTIYISLSYLGENEIANEYIEKLLTNKEWDEINRGFHLVYYGDQIYIPRRGLSQKDKLGSCNKTFSQLYYRVINATSAKNIDIEIFTLVSLCIQRLDRKKTLNDKQISQMSSLLKQKNILRLIRNSNVYEFCKCASKYFGNTDFSVLSPLMEMYNIKFVSRQGWVIRNIHNCESIASHILFAYYLALFFLPDNSNDVNYDKQIILQMLLIHDLAESRYGDIILKNENDKKNEKDYFKEFSFLSYMLPHENGIFKLYELWDDFENKKTINGKIAKEIDGLEAVNQFLNYKFNQNEESENTKLDIKEWIDEFKNKNPDMHIYVKSIFDIIQSYYMIDKVL